MDEETARRTATPGQEAYACSARCGAWHHRNRAQRSQGKNRRKRQPWRWGDYTSASPEWSPVAAFDVLAELRKLL